MITVYKLVSRAYNGLRSFIFDMPYSITYIPGEKALPPVGKLFAFDNEASIRWERSSYGGDHIEMWKASAEKIEKCPPLILALAHSPVHMRQFWNGEYLGECLFIPPTGTILCDSITLIERIDK